MISSDPQRSAKRFCPCLEESTGAEHAGISHDDEGPAGHAAISSRRHPIALIGSVMLVVLLAGCSVGPPPHAQTKASTTLLSLPEAKSIALSVDRRLLASIPHEFVAASTVQEMGGLMPCTAGGWSWSNVVFIELTSVFNLRETFDAIENELRADPTFEVERDKGITGVPGLTVKGADGASYFVSFYEAKASADILAFSPCLELPEGADHRDLF